MTKKKTPQRLCVRENLYNFTMTTNSLSEQIINRTPQLNNRAENQTVKKKPTNFSAVSSVDPNDEMIMLIMRCLILLSYIFGKKSALCLCLEP